MNDTQKIIETALADSANLYRIIAEPSFISHILEVGLVCARALSAGGKLLLFGNGGSAADAQHLAAEMVGRFKKERDALPALALTTNTSILTAIGNDYEFESIFERQIAALCRIGDVAIGISTSGNSSNVLRGLKKAKEVGATAVGLLGSGGGKILPLCDIAIVVPSSNTPRIQEAHIFIGHILCELIEELLFGGQQ
ncbi:Phosphoheptose isomerase [Neomoorella glycerini]|uniref:Phosphoheptose isomerase n=1 Tax=Neomoorella glycerini TaxID=55779 RepID=A0A6I5ZSI7_9FIRM|nr:D-sedoheptulose 7-phosphate isomerase [Moorella glycerini]QGP92679.1 Phosphoheptose isomerase [Moorella glycerini]